MMSLPRSVFWRMINGCVFISTPLTDIGASRIESNGVSRMRPVPPFALKECLMKSFDHFTYAFFTDDECEVVSRRPGHNRRNVYISKHTGNLRSHFGRVAQPFAHQTNDGAIFFDL